MPGHNQSPASNNILITEVKDRFFQTPVLNRSNLILSRIYNQYVAVLIAILFVVLNTRYCDGLHNV